MAAGSPCRWGGLLHGRTRSVPALCFFDRARSCLLMWGEGGGGRRAEQQTTSE